MAIDGELWIWQKIEPPIDLLAMPYQNLKTMVLLAAARAGTKAEWHRGTGNSVSKGMLEIDRELSQISKALNDTEKGWLRRR